jgi:hypothetical protein
VAARAVPVVAGDNGDTAASPLPFLGALVIVVLVVIGIGMVTMLHHDADDEREAVVRAALAQNDALQRLDYPDYRANTCAAQSGPEGDVIARQRDSSAAKGARYVDNVTGVSIAGDRATAGVTYSFGRSRDAKIDTATTFAREDGVWRVCSPGPL